MYSCHFSESLISDEERQALMRLSLEHVAGRVLKIVTISHFATKIAVERAEQSKALGAEAVMMMPPYHGALLKGTPAQTFEQVAEISKVGIPIMIQDAPLSGVELSVSLLVEMVEFEMVKCSKSSRPLAKSGRSSPKVAQQSKRPLMVKKRLRRWLIWMLAQQGQ